MTPKMKDTIPEGWHTYTLGEIYTERKEAGNPELPILTVSIHSGVSDGALDEEEIGKTVKRIADKTQYKTARVGDLVFNMMRAWQGAIGVARSDGLVSPAYIVATPNEELVYPLFMDYYMKSPKMVGIINRQSYGVTDFRKRLYWDSFAPIKCTLPSIAEQKKITRAIEIQDRIIETKEKLLHEKRRKKKYFMQQLIDKHCMEENKDSWDSASFLDVFSFLSTNSLSREFMGDAGLVHNIHYGDILTEYGEILDVRDQIIPTLTISKPELFADFAVDGDVIIADTAEDYTAGKVTEVQNVGDKKIVAGLHTIFCRPKSGHFAPGWLGYFMNSQSYHSQLRRYIAGVKVMSISKGNIINTAIFIPPIDEQRTIVNVLSAIDREIKLLQASTKLEKQKKKALMQLLLTGTVRVNNG